MTAPLAETRDLPLERPPDVPLWVENFWWLTFEPSQSVGVMVHLASLPHDFRLVRQTVFVFLPDGDLVCDLSVGDAARTSHRVCGPTTVAECVRPFEEWRVRFDGMAERATIDGMWAGALRHGPRVPVRFDLTCRCLSPAWDAGGGGEDDEMHGQVWASQHYQQTVQLSGSLEVDGRQHDVNCLGVRDHSRGARDLSSWGSHCLLSAPFPDGRAFGLMVMLGADGTPILNTAYTVRDGVIGRGRVGTAPPPLTERVLDSESFEVELEIGQDLHRIGVETAPAGRLRSFLTMLPPNDLVIGLSRDHPLPIGLSWVPATYTWGEHRATGVVERSAVATTLDQATPASSAVLGSVPASRSRPG